MASFFKKKARDSGGPPSRQFYVEFLGWLPCRGIRGNIYTNAVGHELIQRKKQFPDVPKMTLQVSLNEIKISNDNSEEHRKEKITSVKYSCIMMKNVMYATCMIPPNADIATCIYLAHRPVTNSMLQSHVYRFDSPLTASTFVDLINKVVEAPQHQEYVSQIEEQLRHDGFLQAVVGNPPPQSKYQQKGHWGPTSDAPPEEVTDPEPEPYFSPEMQSMQAVALELKQKLRSHEGPLLLPPKDYDTVHRKHGKLNDISSRKCLNEILVGRTAIEAAASASGNMSLLDEQDQDKEPNATPIYYPPKLPPDHEMVYPPTSVESPPVMRRESPYRRNNRGNNDSSFLSNSSGGSDRNYRASYSPPSQSSPPPVINRGHMSAYETYPTLSAYETYPTLKSSERSPVATSNPDMSKRNHPHHTRESSMSSTHSGLSTHSDPSQKLSQMVNETDLEIPPDYDEAPQNTNPSNWILKDGHPGYSNARSLDNYYDPHRDHSHQGPSMVNAYPQHSPTYVQSTPNRSELYSRPTERIEPVQR